MSTLSSLKWFGRASAGVSVLAGSLLASPPFAHAYRAQDPPKATVVHTYGTTKAWEIANVIPVNLAKLRPLLPTGYEAVPASAQGFGTSEQGIVVVVNFHAMDYRVDQRAPRQSTIIDVAILVREPQKNATLAGLSIRGALHFYTLAIATDDPVYAASLDDGGLPVTRVKEIAYNRQIDDSTGVGTLTVSVPADRPFLHSVNNAAGYQRVPGGALDPVFWYNGNKYISALHFHAEPFAQGQALSQIYTRPGSQLNGLIAGGGSGQCPPDPQTRHPCVTSPSLNLRYYKDKGELKVLAR